MDQPTSSNRPIKREPPSTPGGSILVSSRSPSPAPRSTKRSRDRLFAALQLGNPLIRGPRTISTADHLDELELKRCFEILHACGAATDPSASLMSTRDTMEGFLDAVFKEWTGNFEDELPKPAMDFVVREFVSVGNICGKPANHSTSKSCADSPSCITPVFLVATYRSKPAQLEAGFCIDEPPRNPNDQVEDLFCPMERTDIRWEVGDWLGILKSEMSRACTAKIHKYNKHLAVWYARSLVRGWAMGSVSMGEDREVLGFVGRESVDAVFAMMGN
ncbi:hypothetical protein CEP54_007152 [Fusarium duplospermum]|uniref:Uncharacterized protein n=1 Tax=Fusarium duplospermum TaxID=1325734 RepID=A0A428Q332_9HYPO|nr:hypothetical protein CEP54_007152 [Fusarium duplospermum]